MSMRDLIVIVDGYSVAPEEDVMTTPKPLKEDHTYTNSCLGVSEDGNTVLLEGAGAHLRITSDAEEFQASWDGELSSQAAEKLVQIITESEDREVYCLNAMTFMLKCQALAAAKSLSKHP